MRNLFDALAFARRLLTSVLSLVLLKLTKGTYFIVSKVIIVKRKTSTKGGDLNGVSHNLLNKSYKCYTDAKLIHTRSLFEAKRAFRNNTVYGGKRFWPRQLFLP
jgi:hypothetical protein